MIVRWPWRLGAPSARAPGGAARCRRLCWASRCKASDRHILLLPLVASCWRAQGQRRRAGCAQSRSRAACGLPARPRASSFDTAAAVEDRAMLLGAGLLALGPMQVWSALALAHPPGPVRRHSSPAINTLSPHQASLSQRTSKQPNDLPQPRCAKAHQRPLPALRSDRRRGKLPGAGCDGVGAPPPTRSRALPLLPCRPGEAYERINHTHRPDSR